MSEHENKREYTHEPTNFSEQRMSSNNYLRFYGAILVFGWRS